MTQPNQATQSNSELTQRCIESLNRHSHLKTSFQNGTDTEQRNIITAWFVGATEGGSSSSGLSATQSSTPNLEQFVRDVLPQVRKAA